MSSRTARRLLTELASFSATPTSILTLAPISDSNLFAWEAEIVGPVDTAFTGFLFVLSIVVPENYPASPPRISFKTGKRVFHPNVQFTTGEICLDVLKDQWSPIWTLSSACFAVQSLLAGPEPSSPLNVDAANLLRCGDQVAFDSMARMFLRLALVSLSFEAVLR